MDKGCYLNDILSNYAYHHSIWHQLSITRNQKLNDKHKIQNNINKTGNLVIDFNQIYTTKSINEIAEMLISELKIIFWQRWVLEKPFMHLIRINYLIINS